MDFFVLYDEAHRIFAVKTVDILGDHLKLLLVPSNDKASLGLTMNEGVDVDYCTPRVCLLLTRPKFANLGLCSPGAHATCRRDC